MNVKDYIKVYNVIPKEVCEDIILRYENDEQWKTHAWYSSAADSKGQRHNKELDVLYEKDLIVLEPYFGQSLMSYYADIGLDSLVSYHSKPRLNKYTSGTIMSEHFDLIRRNKQDGIPVLTFLGILNDNYKGGQFLMNGEVMELKQGDMIVFPSTFLYPHKVDEVTEGTRYSVVAWAY